MQNRDLHSIHPGGKVTDLFESYEMKVDTSFKTNNFPLCYCEDVVSLWVSHSSKNPERPYFRCQDTSADTKCDFFPLGRHQAEEKKKICQQKMCVQAEGAKRKAKAEERKAS